VAVIWRPGCGLRPSPIAAIALAKERRGWKHDSPTYIALPQHGVHRPWA